MSQEIFPDYKSVEPAPPSFMQSFLENQAVEYAIKIRNLSVFFGDVCAVSNVSISATQGEIITVLGKSGSGKTTILKSILGLVRHSGGTIQLRGKDVSSTPPEDRRVGMVFQDASLFPHMTVFQNIAFPLIVQQTRRHLFTAVKLFLSRPPKAISRLVEDTLSLVHLEKHAQKRPSQLSGGEQQRVAIARALITSTDLLCLDEPFASLDKPLRNALLDELRDINDRLNTTIIYVTHDSSEALGVSHKIAILHEGAIVEFGEPNVLYNSPRKAITATLLGQCNVFKIRELLPTEDGTMVVTERGTRLSSNALAKSNSPYVGVYPSDLRLSTKDEQYTVPGRVLKRTFLGSHAVFTCALETGDIVRVTVEACSLPQHPTIGQTLFIPYSPERVFLLEDPAEPHSGSDRF